jgi:RNA polymerase sigma factor (TIGR02999 family)
MCKFWGGVGLTSPNSFSPWPGEFSTIAPVSEVTRMLQAIHQGEPGATEQLLSLVYGELRGMARQKMAQESPDHTLQPTALVNEVWLRLGGDQQPAWQNRAHFFAAAAEAMRRILIDAARKRRAVRHGGGLARVSLDDQDPAAPSNNDDQLLAVHEALDGLAAEDPIGADLVKLRYFAGMKMEEAAAALGIPQRRAERLWAYARAWLRQKIEVDRKN